MCLLLAIKVHRSYLFLLGGLPYSTTYQISQIIEKMSLAIGACRLSFMPGNESSRPTCTVTIVN